MNSMKLVLCCIMIAPQPWGNATISKKSCNAEKIRDVVIWNCALRGNVHKASCAVCWHPDSGDTLIDRRILHQSWSMFRFKSLTVLRKSIQTLICIEAKDKPRRFIRCS